MTVAAKAPIPGPARRQFNRPLAAWGRARAGELATQGRTYDQIASEVGFANRGTAYRVVRKALDENVAQAVEEYRGVEVARLNALQAAMWDKALDDNVDAVDAVLKIVLARVKLLGPDSGSPSGADPRCRTVVVPAAIGTCWQEPVSVSPGRKRRWRRRSH